MKRSCFSLGPLPAYVAVQMQLHASCAARSGKGVLLLGAPGSGKSDLLLRLIDIGFELVADDRVEITDGWASAPLALAGLLEVRGFGIVRLQHIVSARLALAVELGVGPRLPEPRRMSNPDLPVVKIDPTLASASHRVALALDCTLGIRTMVTGAFA